MQCSLTDGILFKIHTVGISASAALSFGRVFFWNLRSIAISILKCSVFQPTFQDLGSAKAHDHVKYQLPILISVSLILAVNIWVSNNSDFVRYSQGLITPRTTFKPWVKSLYRWYSHVISPQTTLTYMLWKIVAEIGVMGKTCTY